MLISPVCKRCLVTRSSLGAVSASLMVLVGAYLLGPVAPGAKHTALSAAEPREEDVPDDGEGSRSLGDLDEAVKQQLANGRFRQAFEAQQALVEKLSQTLGAEAGVVRYGKAYQESLGRLASLNGSKAHAAKDAMTGCFTALRLRDRGDLIGARRKCRRACAILETLLEDDDVVRIDALFTFGEIEHQIGNLRAARAHFSTSVKGTQKVLGNQGHEYALAVASLGKVELDLAFLAEAKIHLEEARKIWSAPATRHTSRLVTTWFNLAMLESAREDHAAVEVCAKAGIAAALEDLENAGGSYSLCRLELISSLLDQKKLKEAAQYCREVVEELESGDAIFSASEAASLYEFQGFALRSLNELEAAAQGDAKADLLRQGLQEESEG